MPSKKAQRPRKLTRMSSTGSRPPMSSSVTSTFSGKITSWATTCAQTLHAIIWVVAALHAGVKPTAVQWEIKYLLEVL